MVIGYFHFLVEQLILLLFFVLFYGVLLYHIVLIFFQHIWMLCSVFFLLFDLDILLWFVYFLLLWLFLLHHFLCLLAFLVRFRLLIHQLFGYLLPNLLLWFLQNSILFLEYLVIFGFHLHICRLLYCKRSLRSMDLSFLLCIQMLLDRFLVMFVRLLVHQLFFYGFLDCLLQNVLDLLRHYFLVVLLHIDLPLLRLDMDLLKNIQSFGHIVDFFWYSLLDPVLYLYFHILLLLQVFFHIDMLGLCPSCLLMLSLMENILILRFHLLLNYRLFLFEFLVHLVHPTLLLMGCLVHLYLNYASSLFLHIVWLCLLRSFSL